MVPKAPVDAQPLVKAPSSSSSSSCSEPSETLAWIGGVLPEQVRQIADTWPETFVRLRDLFVKSSFDIGRITRTGRVNLDLPDEPFIFRLSVSGFRKARTSPGQETLRGFHGSSPMGVRGILTDGYLKGSAAGLEGAQLHPYFSAAAGVMTIDEMVGLYKSLMKRGWTKNRCGIVFEVGATGPWERLERGGCEAEALVTGAGGIAHMAIQRENRWTAHDERVQILALWVWPWALEGHLWNEEVL